MLKFKLNKEELKVNKEIISNAIFNHANRLKDNVEWFFKKPTYDKQFVKHCRKGKRKRISLFDNEGIVNNVVIQVGVLDVWVKFKFRDYEDYVNVKFDEVLFNMSDRKLIKYIDKALKQIYFRNIRGEYKGKNMINFFATGYVNKGKAK